MQTEKYHSRFGAILDRALANPLYRFKIVGHASPLTLAFDLVHSADSKISDLPHLVVCSGSKAAQEIDAHIRFFDPDIKTEVLPHFDVSPYSTLYPQRGVGANRVNWLARAQSAKAGEIFIAPIGALQQKSIPFSVLNKNVRSFRIGDELSDNLAKTLSHLGYLSVSTVEDIGQFALRGGVLDIFSAAHSLPVRVELFGDQIESLRFFDPSSQRSTSETNQFTLIPAREVLYALDGQDEHLIKRFRESIKDRDLDPVEIENTIQNLLRSRVFPGIEFLLPYFYENAEQPLEHFSSELNIWMLDQIEVARSSDQLLEQMRSEYSGAENHVLRPKVDQLFVSFDDLAWPPDSRQFLISSIDLKDFEESADIETLSYHSYPTLDFSNLLQRHAPGSDAWSEDANKKLRSWRSEGYSIFVACRNIGQAERIKILLERLDWEPVILGENGYSWEEWIYSQNNDPHLIHIIPRPLQESARLAEELIVFLRDEDFFGKKQSTRRSAQQQFSEKAEKISFGELKPGDLIVHKKHGIGKYEGLEVMPIQGIDTEFLQIHYKGKDKLYVPVYRIGDVQKYSGSSATISLDKLGGTGWEKTKGKVRKSLRDLASDLLRLYAKRKESKRDPLPPPDQDYIGFEGAFPFEETEDQLRAVNEIISDFSSDTPMDRLVCGDVGFGKTEVAMRAAFKMVQNQKQVAVLAPTTVLTFQHLETFKRRFKSWPIRIEALNRFVPRKDQTEIMKDIKAGKVDIVIGTHRLLSKEVQFKELGLLIVDEEQKFGVAHKEKIRKYQVNVDTLAMSATPIPRTLNMSMMGIRDLSLINTPPVDRLPTRTFITKWNDETIRKAVESELQRGGQIFFIHNRVQSIHGVAAEIRRILPSIRMKVAHGQMPEHELEKAMLSFFKHEIDMLICTTIVESGMDIPNANTMFIDDAHMYGLSQLYQLRGRVGRSKERAYCYLIVPATKPLDKDAQERLRVIQENTALGSGIRIAQYDLELRGAGNLLGEDQSGNVNSVGYEMYMQLLQEAIAESKGEEIEEELDPEISIRVAALIPQQYIQDLRLRLSYYKAMTQIQGPEDADALEEELRDQFGKPPEQVYNLLGLMLIRAHCKTLGVRELRSGSKNISLAFTEKTPLATESVIKLASHPSKKYSLTPESQLLIRINEITWPRIYEELDYLIKLT